MTGISLASEEASRATPRSMRSFYFVWLGEVISILGSGLTAFALSIWIFQKTGLATPFAITALLSSLPRILLAPVAGTLVDRWNRRRVMIAADVLAALVTLMVVAFLWRGSLEVWHIYVFAALNASVAAFQEPAYTASVTMLVPKEQLTRAAGLMQAGQSVEMLLAPLAAGALLGLIGLQGIILIDFVTFLFAVTTLLFVFIPQPAYTPTGSQGKKPGFFTEALFGFRYLYQKVGLWYLLLYYALVNFLLNLTMVLSGPLVLSFSTPTAYGAIQTAGGVGILTGSILLSAWGGPKRRIPGIIAAISFASLGLLLAGLRPSIWLIGIGFFILMFCVPLASGPSQAIFQTKVAPGVQGRVFSIRNLISRSMMPLAYVLAGLLSDRLFEPLLRPGGALTGTTLARIVGEGAGRGTALIYLFSALLLIVVSFLAFANPRIRNLESELSDEVE